MSVYRSLVKSKSYEEHSCAAITCDNILIEITCACTVIIPLTCSGEYAGMLAGESVGLNSQLTVKLSAVVGNCKKNNNLLTLLGEVCCGNSSGIASGDYTSRLVGIVLVDNLVGEVDIAVELFLCSTLCRTKICIDVRRSLRAA
jgi:hypothetical protein